MTCIMVSLFNSGYLKIRTKFESQSQSLSGKICPQCSNSYFLLDNAKQSYTSSGSSIQCNTYRCPNCELEIKHRWVKQVPHREKVLGTSLTGNPLSNMSSKRSINPLKIPSSI